jgi:hypothetical protein
MRYANWKYIAELAKAHEPPHYLETGICAGRSLEALLGVWHPRSMTLCDWWDPAYRGAPYGSHQHIEELLRTLDYGGDVHYLDGDSHVLLRGLPEKFYHLIHIDGDHSFDGALADLRDSWRLLAPGGHIVLDDLIHAPSVLRALEVFLLEYPECREVTRDLQNPDGCSVLRKV